MKQLGNSYIPNLWYYDQLLFVKNHYTKEDLKEERQSHERQIIKIDDDITTEEFTILNVTDDATAATTLHEEETYEMTEIEEHLEDDEYYGHSDSQLSETQVPEAVALVEETHVLEKDEECSTFGKHIGLELQMMGERQRIIAKKLLSDVAFYGRLGRLTEHTEISCTQNPKIE